MDVASPGLEAASRTYSGVGASSFTRACRVGPMRNRQRRRVVSLCMGDRKPTLEDRRNSRSGKDALRHAGGEARATAEAGTGWYEWLARTGLIAKGVSFGIVGILAFKLSLGSGGKATSREGALQSLAQNSFGKILLVFLALGFAAYAIWRFVQALAEREDAEDAGEAKGKAKKWGKRAGYVGRALIYGALSLTTVRILTNSDEKQSQSQQAKQTTSTVFDLPAGRWLVGLAGLCIIGAGLWNAYRGLTRAFEDKWRVGEMSRAEHSWGSRIGVLGHLARAVVFGLVGVFITKAAIDYNAKEAIGLDGALQKLAQQSYGQWLLGLTALGLLAYGIYCLVDARYRDVSANSD